ncbi:MAG TPA: protein-L-isoaspartate(D-aspartate) O-methyltransferase [Burkholderiaceae bacterium]|nr:protein-L-isoaspartate(D-aspartate) O-methyltransferase [Burkholderiaceae bacterium]
MKPVLSARVGLDSARVRERMVERLREQGIRDARVLDALASVPRHVFVDPAFASRAYEDTALPIGEGQTISQPYVVARCAELAVAGRTDLTQAKVLEVGSGCGYAAAVLARLFGIVISIERIRTLHELARQRLRPLRLPNVHLLLGDGMKGCPAEAPFVAIVAAAAGAEVPQPWIEQLAPRGKIIAPVGATAQNLVVVEKDAEGRIRKTRAEAVRFVPLRSGLQ